MARRENMAEWETQLIREGDALSKMNRLVGPPATRGKRLIGIRIKQKTTQVATVHNRDKAAMHVGFAPDRIWG